MSRTDAVIRTPGRPPTFISPREDGGWVIGQGKNGEKNKIHLAADETEILVEILTR